MERVEFSQQPSGRARVRLSSREIVSERESLPRTTNMPAMTSQQAEKFASKWLPAWSGNQPRRLAEFYTDDVYYSDPTVPGGVVGKDALIRYFGKLLGENPNWVWTNEDGVPLEDGFLNKWRLEAPVGDRVVHCRGVCLVQMRDHLIYRNETYFDMLELVTAIRDWNKRKRVSTEKDSVLVK